MVKKLLLIFLFIYIPINSSGCTSIIQSHRSEATLKKGVVYANKRQYVKAETALMKSLTYQPGNADAWVTLGDIYFNIENYDGARYAYHEALRYDQDASNAYSGLWKVRLEESGYTEESKREVKAEIEAFISPGDKRADRLMAAYKGLIFLHEDDRAGEIVREIMTLEPDEKTIEALSSYASEKLLSEKDVEKRLGMAEDFLRIFPFSKERYMAYFIRMKIAAEELKDKEMLFKYGEEWIRDEPESRRANFYVGYRYTKEDIALETAVSYIKRALSLIEDPDPADKPEYYPEAEWQKDLRKTKGTYYDTLGWAYYKLGRYKEAEKAYRRAPDYLDFDQDLYYHLGLLLEEKGDIEGAIHSYVQALKSGENKEAEERLQKIVSSKTPPGEGPLNKFFAGEEGITTFTDATEESGLGGVKANWISWGDYNNDGYEDLLFKGALLFRNNGDGTFTDVTKEAGITDIPGAHGGVWGDFNNDGYLDFYTFTSGKGTIDRFWRSNRDGTFTDITTTAVETPDNYPTQAAAWGDYDNDGYLDLYVANYEKPLSETVGRGMCTPDRLYHNNGDGTFTDVGATAGVGSLENMCGRGVNWGDYDNDADLDIYVSNYRLDPNFLWRNNGDGTFTNAAAENGVEGSEEEGAYGHSIGSEWGDYDSDGDLDLFVANLAHPRYIGVSDKSMLLENQGPPDFRFVNKFGGSGIRFEETSADPSFADYDNDGILDLYFTSTYSGRKSFLYRGKGGGTFTDVTWLAGVRVDNGWGNAFADYDNDGDLDLLVASGDGVRLFRNDGNSNHWVHVRATGRESNSSGIGARVIVVPGDKLDGQSPLLSPSLSQAPAWERDAKREFNTEKGDGGFGKQIREVQGGKGTGTQHSIPVEFGLGAYNGPVDVEVRFPSGKVVRLYSINTDQRIVVEE